MDKTKELSLVARVVVSLTTGRVAPGNDFTCDDDLGRTLIRNGSARLKSDDPAQISVDGDGDGAKAGEAASGASPSLSLVESNKDAAGTGHVGTDKDVSLEERIRSVLLARLEADPEQNNDAFWIKSGEPRNGSLDEELGVDVTNEVTHPIWAEIVAARTPANDSPTE